MIELYKKRSETPLEALTRLRQEKPELSTEILSYAGRLDPMAEGILPVLVGKEENKNRALFLKKDKEYQVEFLIGCSTDTGDVLGVITGADFKKIDEDKIKKVLEKLVDLKEQTYPWYSSKTVEGIPLFEHARNNNFSIERPKRDVTIYEVSDIVIKNEDSEMIMENLIRDIKFVQGDFRQVESMRSWNSAFRAVTEDLQVVSCTLRVSSGTYIRALAEEIGLLLEIPVVVHKLVRTKVL